MSVYESLESYLRSPYYNPVYSSRHSRHEAIKAQLYVLGFKLGYLSILEASICGDVRNGRIDCIFVDRGDVNRVVCAFEIDGSLRDKSSVKLLTLPEYTEKIVISFGSVSSWDKMVSRRDGDGLPYGIKFFRVLFKGQMTGKRE
jgi:hypothetical protein